MSEQKKHRWIIDDIVIDFPLTKVMQDTIKKMELLDEANDTCYDEWFDELDVLAKERVANGKMTHKQWDLLLKKYGENIE